MTNYAKTFRFLICSIAFAGSIVLCGAAEANAQTRDPFSKPGWARTRETRPGSGAAKTPAAPVNLGAPAIQQRIECIDL